MECYIFVWLTGRFYLVKLAESDVEGTRVRGVATERHILEWKHDGSIWMHSGLEWFRRLLHPVGNTGTTYFS
jgi:hypothetical protein